MIIIIIMAGLNALLALTAGVVYLRNHRQIRSPFTLALTLFALFFVVHNAVLIYHFFTMMDSLGGEVFLFAEGLLQTAALGTLLWATLR